MGWFYDGAMLEKRCLFICMVVQVTASVADSAELKASPSKDASAVYGPMLER